MKKIILASNNKGKIAEVKEILKDMNVELLGELPMHRAITNYGSIELIEEEEEVAELFDPIVEKIIEKSKKKLIL